MRWQLLSRQYREWRDNSLNVETFRGNVTSSGTVRASVTVQEKHASGTEAFERVGPGQLAHT
jgi:hypothetical protein